MKTTFLIQTQLCGYELEIPYPDFGCAAISAIGYHNLADSDPMDFKLIRNLTTPHNISLDSLDLKSCVPVGNVEYVLSYFHKIGIEEVHPLNIPQNLWNLCHHEVFVDYLTNHYGEYMVKDLNIFNSLMNGHVDLSSNRSPGCMPFDLFFLSEWLPFVQSEWRVFVYKGEILDVRNYAGDFWKTPDRNYIEQIVGEYDNSSYVLDVMVTPRGTDLLNVHDFFGCRLYGFEHYLLPDMWKCAINNVIERTQKNGN